VPETGGATPSPASADQNYSLPETGIDLNKMVNSIERNMILRALEKTGGVRSKAAELLGLNRTTLIEKIKKMGIEPQRKESVRNSDALS
jgi:DNA-binding NtrC family response regulator